MVPLFLVCALLGLVPTDPAILDRVDLVEVNHVLDSSGRPVLDQMIFYQWSRVDSRYQVIAWRLLRSPGQIPRRDWNQRVYVSHWFDAKTLRKVVAGQCRETWTTHDPEMAERAIYPIQYRRELTTGTLRGVQALSLR